MDAQRVLELSFCAFTLSLIIKKKEKEVLSTRSEKNLKNFAGFFACRSF